MAKTVLGKMPVIDFDIFAGWKIKGKDWQSRRQARHSDIGHSRFLAPEIEKQGEEPLVFPSLGMIVFCLLPTAVYFYMVRRKEEE